MAEGVLMPKAGISVEECIITEWEKKVGDQVKVGDILFSYETDKAAFECECTAEGELLEIFYEDGAEVPVLVNVCAVGKKGEDVSSLRPSDETAAETSESTAVETPATETVAAAEVVAPVVHEGDIKISPRAKSLAAKVGVDASITAGTGPKGRIIEQDIRTALANGQGGTGLGGKVVVADSEKPAVAAAAPAVAASAAEITYTDEKLSNIRKVIAKSMLNSLSTSAQLTNNHSFDAGSILSYRKQLKANAETMDLPNITLNDIILYAVSRTLLSHPDLNANLIEGNVLRRFNDVHLGVATDTPRGLMVPTIFFANRKSLAEISAEAKELFAKCKSGTINPDLLSGATFTVTNLGSLGVESFTPVINPPQTGILGVDNIVTRVKAVGEEIKTYSAMGLSMTFDHRAVDGAPAARFVVDLIHNLENFPLLLAK